MKTLNTYINEKLVLNKDTFRKAKYKYFPEKKRELESIITDLLDKHAGQEVIDLNDIDISNINDISFLFYKRNDIYNIDISNWDVSNVTNMSSIFYNCKNLQSIGDISGWNVSAVKDMGGMFYNCIYLTHIGDISSWNISKAEYIHTMFTSCKSLESIGDISGWDISNIADMGYMFYGCKKLKDVGDLNSWGDTIQNKCDYWQRNIVEDMFDESGIKNIPSWYKD